MTRNQDRKRLKAAARPFPRSQTNLSAIYPHSLNLNVLQVTFSSPHLQGETTLTTQAQTYPGPTQNAGLLQILSRNVDGDEQWGMFSQGFQLCSRVLRAVAPAGVEAEAPSMRTSVIEG